MCPQVGAISGLFAVVLVICGGILAFVVAWIVACILLCRAKDGAPEPEQIKGRKNLEITWTAIPFLIVVFIFCMTARVMSTSDPAESRPPDLIITGHQWWWDVRYASNGVHTANEIHIPIGVPLLADIESADVLHDFWAPQLARKIHAVPGHPNHIWLQADKAGTYQGECAEYCGTQHAWMRFLVIAEKPEDFNRWRETQLRPLPTTNFGMAAEGRRVFDQYSCVNCHAVAGVATNATAAPDLTHVAARETLGGCVITNTPESLARWLRNPQGLKPGCLMPNFGLTEDQVRQLVAFFEAKK